MSTTQQLSVNFEGGLASAASDIWLTIEQKPTPVSQNNANLTDMVRMVAQAAAGGSARDYQLEKCAAATIGTDGSLIVTLTVYVWPNPANLSYSMASSAGTVSAGTPIEKIREIDVAVTGSDTVTLPWNAVSSTAEWQLPPVNEFSEPLESPPEVAVDGSKITLSEECYGVLRLRGAAQGFSHEVVLRFNKGLPSDPLQPITVPAEAVNPTTTTMIDVGHSLVSAKATVTASYRNEGGVLQSEILTLKIPPCVLDLLEYCEDGTLLVDNVDFASDTADGGIPTVYYDTCTGNVIELRYEGSPEEDTP